jgi:hypothetical protein
MPGWARAVNAHLGLLSAGRRRAELQGLSARRSSAADYARTASIHIPVRGQPSKLRRRCMPSSGCIRSPSAPNSAMLIDAVFTAAGALVGGLVPWPPLPPQRARQAQALLGHLGRFVDCSSWTAAACRGPTDSKWQAPSVRSLPPRSLTSWLASRCSSNITFSRIFSRRVSPFGAIS